MLARKMRYLLPFWRRNIVMKFVNETIIVGLIWGLLELVLVIFPLYLFGTSSVAGYFFPGYEAGPSPVVPVGWFALAISFVCAFALADVGGAVKALVLSETLAFAMSPLIWTAFPGSAVFSSPDAIAGFFGLLAVFFFLVAMAGTVCGSLVGDWFWEEPGEFRFALRRHGVISLALILVLAVGLSLLGVESAVAAQAQSDARISLLKDPVLVANQTLSWNVGTQIVWANFTENYGRGELVISWTSNPDVSLHYLVSTTPRYEEIFGSYSCAATCIGFTGILITGLNARATAWFQVDNCPVSGCPSGMVRYLITYWHY